MLRFNNVLGVSLIQNEAMINYISRRFGRRYRRWYHWPNDFLPFNWERQKLDPPYLNTGDAVRDVGQWDPNDLIPGAEHSKELKNAPEIVRRQFTLGFAERPVIVANQMNKILSQVRRYPMDNNSPEVKIAEYTVHIRNNLRHFTKVDQYDAPRKIQQEALKNRRQKMLIELYYQDRERYQRLVEMLGIKFTVPKLGEVVKKPTRKGELRRLTREYCEEIKGRKLDEYHQELIKKQQTLDEEKKKIDQLMKEDEKYLGINNKNTNSSSSPKSSK